MAEKEKKFLIRTNEQWTIVAAWDPSIYPHYDQKDTLEIDFDYRLTMFLTIDGIPIYKWTGSEVVSRTPEEIQADRDKLPPPPMTEKECISQLEKEKAELENKVQTLEAADTFNKECLMEMSAIIYA